MPAESPQTDIVSFCVDHTQTGLAVEMIVDAPTDPLADPTWQSSGAAVAFGYETVDGSRRIINLVRRGSAATFEYLVLEPDGQAVCVGDATFGAASIQGPSGPPDHAATEAPAYRAHIPTGCLDAPDTIEVGAQMFYDLTDDQQSGFFDAAPGDGGFIAVPRTAPEGSAQVTRLAGPSRIETAIAVAQESHVDGTAGAVVVARSEDFPDALVAAPLADSLDAPVLLTPSDEVSDQVLDEIDRLLGGSGDVVLLGGTAALSDAVADQITAAGHTVTRVAGDSRFATAVEVARAASPDPRTIVLAGGGDFPDALLAGAAAPAVDGVAVLVDDAGIPSGVQDYLDDHPDALILTVGPVATGAVQDPDAYADGANPAQTSAVLLKLYGEVDEVGLASLEDFPDGLAGGAYAAARRIPLLLSPADAMDTAVIDALADRGPFSQVTLFGGVAALSDTVAGQAAGHLTATAGL